MVLTRDTMELGKVTVNDVDGFGEDNYHLGKV